MRVIHVITTISRGGAENQLLLLAAEQVRQGCEVEVVPLKDRLDLLDDFRKRGVNINLDAWGKSITNQILAIRRICQSSNSIVHVHLPQAEVITAMAGIRNVFCSRHYGSQFYPNKSERMSRILSRLATRNAQVVISISRFVEEFLRTNKEVRAGLPIKTIHYGINLEDVSNFVHERTLSPSKSPIIIGTLARLSPEKDLSTLIGGVEILAKQLPEQKIELHVYGEGNLYSTFQTYIEKNRLNNFIFLKGKTHEPLKTMSGFDIFVLTSKFEGFGLVLLEALSLEIPVVSSEIPTAMEVLGETGVYFKVGDQSDLASKISDVLIRKGVNQSLQHERAKIFDIKVKTMELLKTYSEFTDRQEK